MLIDVTVDVRDLDPDAGPAPDGASVTFARLTPTETAGTLVTTATVALPLEDGHGTTRLAADTVYLVRCYRIRGFSTPFAVRTPAGPTSLGALWRTGQVEPATIVPLPNVPPSVQDLLDEAERLLGTAVVGPQGERGLQGVPGVDGRDGRDGAEGNRGLQGVPGDPGRPGRDGADGQPGRDGQQGLQGPVGPAGLTWRGTWNPTRDYVTDDAVYYDDGLGNDRSAAAWIASQDPPPGEVPSDSSTYWQVLSLRGPRGLPGIDGKDGKQGVQGDAGARGPDGPQGVPGNPGGAGKDGVSVTSASASALSAGSQPTATLTNGALALGIPIGAKGDPGAPGAAGAGVPAGGSTGQVLRKLSATDRDTGWQDAGYQSTFVDASSGGSDGTVTTQGIPASFTQINLPTENSDAGNNFDPSTSLYTVPSPGLYLVVAKVRIKDTDGAGRGFGIGVHTSAIDGPWFAWQTIGSPTGGRVVLDYQRIVRLAAADTLRLYAYATSATTLASASLTVIRIA